MLVGSGLFENPSPWAKKPGIVGGALGYLCADESIISPLPLERRSCCL
jgi:hypothetical protein